MLPPTFLYYLFLMYLKYVPRRYLFALLSLISELVQWNTPAQFLLYKSFNADFIIFQVFKIYNKKADEFNLKRKL